MSVSAPTGLVKLFYAPDGPLSPPSHQQHQATPSLRSSPPPVMSVSAPTGLVKLFYAPDGPLSPPSHQQHQATPSLRLSPPPVMSFTAALAATRHHQSAVRTSTTEPHLHRTVLDLPLKLPDNKTTSTMDKIRKAAKTATLFGAGVMKLAQGELMSGISGAATIGKVVAGPLAADEVESPYKTIGLWIANVLSYVMGQISSIQVILLYLADANMVRMCGRRGRCTGTACHVCCDALHTERLFIPLTLCKRTLSLPGRRCGIITPFHFLPCTMLY